MAKLLIPKCRKGTLHESHEVAVWGMNVRPFSFIAGNSREGLPRLSYNLIELPSVKLHLENTRVF